MLLKIDDSIGRNLDKFNDQIHSNLDNFVSNVFELLDKKLKDRESEQHGLASCSNFHGYDAINQNSLSIPLTAPGWHASPKADKAFLW